MGDDRTERIQRQIEELLRAMDEDGVAGGTILGGELTVGVPRWEARAKGQRYAEQVKTHGYPAGLAKSARWKRDELLAAHRVRVEHMDTEAYAVYHAAKEALAWALDAERFLGSFNRAGHGGIDAERIDAVTEHLLVWLADRGVRLVPTGVVPEMVPSRLIPDLVLAVDPMSGMVLDSPTFRHYQRILDGDLPFEDGGESGALNAAAADWCRALTLSTLLAGETPPPAGKVGQYGRHGCVLRETARSETTLLHDVCLFVYDDRHFGALLDELTAGGTVAFVESPLSILEIADEVSGLHTVSRYDAIAPADEELSQVVRQTDIEAALQWGREHARRLR